MTDLTGKVALITGASRGIGEACAERLAGQGASVFLVARNIAACADIAERIRAAGGTAGSMACDISDHGQMDAAAVAAIDRFGDLDILVNNAGMVEPIGRLEDIDPAQWAHGIAVNLIGTYHGIRAVLPHFRSRGRGVIVNVSSGAAHHALEGWSSYCAAKAGVASLTRSVALEAGDAGIRVYGFGPGTVDTEMQSVIRASGINPVSQMERSQHAPPSVPAQVIAWLCTEDASDLAGQELSIRDDELRRRAGLEA